jgi:hypothetical protein
METAGDVVVMILMMMRFYAMERMLELLNVLALMAAMRMVDLKQHYQGNGCIHRIGLH